ncbi:DUF6758 family protein [Nocardioides rubriscoriae]|uniref:DUF6758 family protein n=1 Tax=Nocardioides rubriscoriae TaxID=642762 RepID=UPI0011E03102|nr:DUF6758 family protein [Nocardioides rubriscoriae]
MSLRVGCPRCAAPVAETEAGWVCVEHGVIEPLWRPAEVTYEAFADHLRRSASMPTYLPWPLSPGWSVSDFAAVGADPERARATMTCTSGPSALDGPVDVIAIAEEAGTGLGARVAGTVHGDPGPDIGDGPPSVRVRIERQVVPLWPISTSAACDEWDRSVVVGEAAGRWLWLVLRPASAMLLLRDDWILRDASQSGPHLVELPFGGPAPAW